MKATADACEALDDLPRIQLPRQELNFGPMRIEARFNQDQNISQDLSPWNQQGSQALRGQKLVSPVDDTLICVEPIHRQPAQARMPQLKKVILAMGNRLVYADSYEEALLRLTRQEVKAAQGRDAPQVEEAQQQAQPSDVSGQTMNRAREILRRDRDYMSEGKYADAGKELEALERTLSGQKK